MCALLLLSGAQAQAASQKEILQTAKQRGLARHPTWLKLLHYERDGKRSVVLTDNFFLSPKGRTDPEAELTATIHAYFFPWDENADAQPRCRFPARYYWLSRQLPLPHYDVREESCQSLEKWALFDTVKSISLHLVSGYLGNPASTFGHAFLKLNTDSMDDQSGLFDMTLNYGALVPENEYILRYVARGLFGGYEAGFSDKYFYTQDLVYSRTEFRDIWDYRLILTDYERTLLILHIWEIVGKKFTYYFLDKNCAYRLAELLELVIEEDLLSHGRFWYLPVELFHRLNDMDNARQKSHGIKRVQSVRFIPSNQRILYHQLKMLTPDELGIFNAIVREGIDSLSTHLPQLSMDRQMVVLDSLLAYQQYKLISEEPNPPRQRREAKDKILLTRLGLPARFMPPLEIPELPSPAEGSRPMALGVGTALDVNDGSFLQLSWSPYKQELVGKNSLEGDELTVLDFTVGISQEGDKVFVDQFDLIRVLNLNTLSVALVDENPWSWQLRVGMDRIEENGKDRYDGVIRFGPGYAQKLKETVLGYGMVDLAGHAQSPFVRLRPHLGLKFDWGATQAWIYSGAESVDYKGAFRYVGGGKIQFPLTDRAAVHVEFSNEKATRASLGLIWFW